jgi:uncharacterized protein YndB with AHSA1/START domain
MPAEPAGDPSGSRVLVAVRVPSSPERAFRAFTDEIGQWWKPNALFPFPGGDAGALAFEGGLEGRLVERSPDGGTFVVGRIRVWEPPVRLVVSWREATFEPGQDTELRVRFDDLGGGETRVTVEHFGWDALPADHAARHGFPLVEFQLRFAEWWRALLEELRSALGGDPAPDEAAC